MQNLYMDKKVIIAIVLVILILGGGGLYVMNSRSTKPVQTAPVEEITTVETLSPESIGLDFQFRKDGKAAKIIVSNAAGIKTIEYQLSYQKMVDGEQVPEGLIGDVDVMGKNSVETDYREFGTCSSGVCRYDNVTSPIKVTMKVTKDDGKVYQVEKSFNLPS